MKPARAHLSQVTLALAAATLTACSTPDSATTPVEGSSQGTTVALTRPASGSRTGPSLEVSGDPEGIVRRNGKLYYLKDQGATLLTPGQRVTPSLFLEKNGEVTLADGRRVRVREGDMVTLGGEVREAPNAVR